MPFRCLVCPVVLAKTSMGATGFYSVRHLFWCMMLMALLDLHWATHHWEDDQELIYIGSQKSSRLVLRRTLSPDDVVIS